MTMPNKILKFLYESDQFAKPPIDTVPDNIEERNWNFTNAYCFFKSAMSMNHGDFRYLSLLTLYLPYKQSKS